MKTIILGTAEHIRIGADIVIHKNAADKAVWGVMAVAMKIEHAIVINITGRIF